MSQATITFSADTMTIDPGNEQAEAESVNYTVTKTAGDAVHIEFKDDEGESQTGKVFVADDHIVMTKDDEPFGLVLVEK
ncbi:MAG: hypothetical protein ACOCVS_03135 [Planctomycetota bacterium]